MTRHLVPALLLASVALPACGGSSGGGGSTDAVTALRASLARAGIQPLPAPPVVSDALFQLGQALFFDKILSGNQDVSCATCHVLAFASADGRTLSDGVGGIGVGPNRGGGAVIPRNSPPLFNLHLQGELFWDGRIGHDGADLVTPAGAALTPEMRAVFDPAFELLAALAMIPPVMRDEMRGQAGENELADLGDDFGAVWAALLERLLDVPRYVELLQAAYPGTALQDFSFAHAGNAIAGFVARGFARTDSPFERFVRGDDAALNEVQLAGGLEFFGRARCARCHSGSTFSDQRHHDTGLPQLGPGKGGGPSGREDFGRELVSGEAGDRYAFRTPMLLNSALTAPYGHAGQFVALRDFVSHYRDPELSNQQYDIGSNVLDPALATSLVPNSVQVLANLDPRLRNPSTFDVEAVVQFVFALTADDALSLEDLAPTDVPSGLPVD